MNKYTKKWIKNRLFLPVIKAGVACMTDGTKYVLDHVKTVIDEKGYDEKRYTWRKIKC